MQRQTRDRQHEHWFSRITDWPVGREGNWGGVVVNQRVRLTRSKLRSDDWSRGILTPRPICTVQRRRSGSGCVSGPLGLLSCEPCQPSARRGRGGFINSSSSHHVNLAPEEAIAFWGKWKVAIRQRSDVSVHKLSEPTQETDDLGRGSGKISLPKFFPAE